MEPSNQQLTVCLPVLMSYLVISARNHRGACSLASLASSHLQHPRHKLDMHGAWHTTAPGTKSNDSKPLDACAEVLGTTTIGPWHRRTYYHASPARAASCLVPFVHHSRACGDHICKVNKDTRATGLSRLQRGEPHQRMRSWRPMRRAPPSSSPARCRKSVNFMSTCSRPWAQGMGTRDGTTSTT